MQIMAPNRLHLGIRISFGRTFNQLQCVMSPNEHRKNENKKNKHTKNFKTSKLMKYFTRILREFLDIKVPSTSPHCGKKSVYLNLVKIFY